MNKGRLDKDGLARRVARDIPDGSFVNLGIGLPTKVSNFLDPSNVSCCTPRMLGMGPEAHGGQVDPDLMNAARSRSPSCPAPVLSPRRLVRMMRGGHLDICVLGAYQVLRQADLANWHTGEPGAIRRRRRHGPGDRRQAHVRDDEPADQTAEAKSCRNAATRSPGWPASAGSTPTTRYSTSSRNAPPSATSSARQSRSSKTSSRCAARRHLSASGALTTDP